MNQFKPSAFLAFLRKRDGLVALEFAIVSPVVIVASIWIFEFSILMIRQQAVEYANMEAARLVRTGEAQRSAAPRDAVRDAMCEASFGWLDCSKINVDIRTYPSFQDIDPPAPNYDDNGMATNFNFEPGGPEQVMLVRTSYPHPIVTPFISSIFKYPVFLTTNAIVRGEPWQ